MYYAKMIVTKVINTFRIALVLVRTEVSPLVSVLARMGFSKGLNSTGTVVALHGS